MKQSLIITAIVCLILGESFSVINQKEKDRQQPAALCSMNVCKPSGVKQKAPLETEPYIPMVNILGYD